VLSTIEIFGDDRCMFGTNWPVDKLFSSYVDLVAAYTEIIADFSRDEQEQLFSRNAERYYRI
jgi:predicted TIM-barrel fold metal-dependent hydrolase